MCRSGLQGTDSFGSLRLNVVISLTALCQAGHVQGPTPTLPTDVCFKVNKSNKPKLIYPPPPHTHSFFFLPSDAYRTRALMLRNVPRSGRVTAQYHGVLAACMTWHSESRAVRTNAPECMHVCKLCLRGEVIFCGAGFRERPTGSWTVGPCLSTPWQGLSFPA